MRRLHYLILAAIFVFSFSAPAAAAEKTAEERIKALEDVFSGVSIYGSIRYATFFEKSDRDFVSDTDSVTKYDSANNAVTLPDQKYTQWGLAGNSRIGVQVDRKDNFRGRVEAALYNDGVIKTRLAYGTYNLNGITFLFGQDYTPLSEWDYSSQVFNGDNNLAGWGVIDVDGKRIPQVKIKWKGLQVALVYPKKATAPNLLTGRPGSYSTSTTVSTAAPDAKVKEEPLMPNLEAKYRLSMDKIFMDVFGGVGSYKIKSHGTGYDIDERITSYSCGIGGGIKLDPIYAKAMIWTARNGRQMSLHQADSVGAPLDPTDYSVIKDKDMGYAIIAGSKIGTMTAEIGYGFVSSDIDADGAEKNNARNYYANLNIPVAQNVIKTASFSVVPEVGVYDYMKDINDNDQGTIRYAGAKWQVNF